MTEPTPTIRFTVFGTPAAQGSYRQVPISRPCPVCHRSEVRIADDSKRTKPWRQAIRKAIDLEPLEHPTAGPVRLSLLFGLPRPRSHYLPANSRRPAPVLRDDAPRHPIGKPDIDKLERAVLDALTGKAYLDDAQVIEVLKAKHYAEASPHLEIRVEVLDA
jgi:crossover junction endodeoxyribonuclease RusA